MKTCRHRGVMKYSLYKGGIISRVLIKALQKKGPFTEVRRYKISSYFPKTIVRYSEEVISFMNYDLYQTYMYATILKYNNLNRIGTFLNVYIHVYLPD